MPNKYITFASDEDWDMSWNFTTNGFDMLEGSDAIAQNIKERLQLFLGEWEYDITEGTAWFQVVYKRPLNLSNAESELKSRVLKTPGVIELLSYDMGYDKANRMINSVTVTVRTATGEIEVTV